VLIVVGSFQDRGGLQGRLSRLATHLAQHRPVTVLTWSACTFPRYETREDGVAVVVVPSLLDWGRDHRPWAAAVNTAFSLLTGLVGAWIVRRGWSVAIAAGLQPEGSLAALAARGRRRFVVTTWSVGPLGNAERVRAAAAGRLVLRLLRGARWFVPQTEEAAAELLKLGVSSDRIRVVGAAVDLRRFQPSRDSRATLRSEGTPRGIAAYTGRFDLRNKRLDLLIQARRAAGLDGWELRLTGAGPDLPELKRMAGTDRSIRFFGWQDDVLPVLRLADVFVLPTRNESMPNALVEAMACGLPGVVSATPGLAARHPAGVLLVANEEPAWTHGLRTIADLDESSRRERGAQARAWAQANADSERANATWETLVS